MNDRPWQDYSMAELLDYRTGFESEADRQSQCRAEMDPRNPDDEYLRDKIHGLWNRIGEIDRELELRRGERRQRREGVSQARPDSEAATTQGTVRCLSAPRNGSVLDVTEATFQAEVLDRSMRVPVVLDLWADWCGPCKQVSPVLESLAVAGGGSWVLAKIDVDANPTIAQALQVQGIPAVKAVFEGQLVAEFSGALPGPQIREWIGALVHAANGSVPAQQAVEVPAAPTVPALHAVDELLSSGDFDGAERQLQAMLRDVQVRRRAATAGSDVVARADAAPDDIELALAAAEAEMAAGQTGAAFDRLIRLIRRTSGDKRNRVRDRLVELFSALGDDDPYVVAARRHLTSALY